jgi:4-carboxymuconolactone decarboxylase
MEGETGLKDGETRGAFRENPSRTGRLLIPAADRAWWSDAMAAKTTPSARRARGARKLRQIHGDHGEAVVAELAGVSPELADFVVDFVFGDVYSRPGLSVRERQLVTVASLTTLGHAQPQLRSHLHGSLNVGVTRREIRETIAQLAVYAGFPAAINAALSAREVFRERDARGIRN